MKSRFALFVVVLSLFAGLLPLGNSPRQAQAAAFH